MGTLRDEMKKWKKANEGKERRVRKHHDTHKSKNSKKQKEGKQHDENYWLELMGVRRPKYRKQGGSWRQS